MENRFIILFFICSCSLLSQPTSWVGSDVGGGGAVYAPAINPHNSSEIYLSCDEGAMFHSLDSAKTWTTLHFNTIAANRFSEVQFTNDNSIRYVLRQNLNNTLYVPNITTNGGQSWTPIPVPGIGQFGAFKLFAHPQQSNIVIVSGEDKIFFSNTNGSSYTLIHTATKPFHFAGVFFDGNNMYLCTNKGLLGIDNNGVSIFNYMTHLNMGASSSGEHFVSFKGAKQGGILRFIGISITSAGFSPRTYGIDVNSFTGIYRMDFNVGPAWTNLTSNFKNGAANNKGYNIAMKPDDVQTFYIGGQAKVPDLPFPASGILLGTVFKSADGGNSYSNVFLNTTYTTNANIYTGWQGSSSGTGWNVQLWNGINTTEGLTVSSNDINYVVRSDKSNVYISTDGGFTWTQRYVSSLQHNPGSLIFQADNYKDNGLQTTVCGWLTWANATNLIASFADLLAIKSSNGGNSWSFNYSGLDTIKVHDASMVIKHPDGKLYAATGDIPGSNGDYSDSRLAQASRGRISVSSDNGLTWQTFYSFTRPVTSIDFNPLNTQQMYVTVASENNGIGGIYKFTDRNNPASILPLPLPAGTQNRAGKIKILIDGSLVVFYTARDNSSTSTPSFSYTASSGVFYSVNDGAAWQSNNPQGMSYDVRSLTVDPNFPSDSVWWACVGNNKDLNVSGNFEGVYMTNNRGINWTKVISGKKAISCTFHPEASNEMYLCTQDEGLYYYTNTHTSPLPVFVSSYPFRFPQQVFFNPYNSKEVWVTSNGNGLKKGMAYPCSLFGSNITLYVDASVQNSGDGKSWVNAFKTLDEALDASWQCSGIQQINIATGIYKPTRKPYEMDVLKRGTEIITNDVNDVTFHFRPGLEVFGGYSAGGSTRDISLYPTILSGDLSNNRHANHTAFLLYSSNWADIADTTFLDGFVIEQGSGNNLSTIVINNQNIIRGNGGGISISNGRYKLTNCSIQNNSALKGGGIYVSTAEILFNGCIMLNNSAQEGPGLNMVNGTCLFDHDNIITGLTLQGGTSSFKANNSVK